MEQIGYLSYAVVAIDGIPDERERKRVREHISRKVRAVVGSKDDSDSADWLISLVAFEEASRHTFKPSALLNGFNRFVNGPNFRHIAPGLRKEAFELLRFAADSLNGTGKAERMLLQRIQNQF